MPRAIWNGTVIAQSDRCEVVEGNPYFPPDAVKREYLRDSPTHTVCGWKGTANYYDVVVDGEANHDATWYYPELSRLMQNPLGAAFARKVLRCKARDEGRTLVLFDESRNAAAGHFSCKPFGAVLCGAICFVTSLANSPAIRLRLPSPHSAPQPTPP